MVRRALALLISVAGLTGATAAQESHLQLRSLSGLVLEGDVLLQSRADVRIDGDRCRNSCSEVPGCAGYTSFPDGRCVLFSRVLERQTFLLGAASGIAAVAGVSSDRISGSASPITGTGVAESAAKCPDGYTAQSDTTVVGGDISLRGLPVSFQRCAELCTEKKECVGYVWMSLSDGLNRDDRCQLKSRLRMAVKSKGTLICERANAR